MKFRPLHDRVVIRRLNAEEKTKGGIIIPDTAQEKPMEGEVIAAGAAMINDINGLQAPDALAAVAAGNVAVCLMHKQGRPADMQVNPHYDDVVAEVLTFLAGRVQAARNAGIAPEHIVIDPGFGFGKTLEHNLELLRGIGRICDTGVAVLAGISRKGMLGSITGREVNERGYASVAAALIAVEKGARIVRVHDVAATRDALAVWAAVNKFT